MILKNTYRKNRSGSLRNKTKELQKESVMMTTVMTDVTYLGRMHGEGHQPTVCNVRVQRVAHILQGVMNLQNVTTKGELYPLSHSHCKSGMTASVLGDVQVRSQQQQQSADSHRNSFIVPIFFPLF